MIVNRDHVSLSRLNHWLPRSQAHPEVVQGTAELHHEIADAFFPQADTIFDDPTTLDTAVDMLDPQPAEVQGLTFRTLCRTSAAILEEPPVEGGAGAIDRRFHTL